MNLDRLLKLLKLANHNLNDAEANSAARAATKLLGEENYKWLEDAKKNGGKPPKPNISGDRTIIYEEANGDTIVRINRFDARDNVIMNRFLHMIREEISKQGTWAGVHRSTEPDFRSTRPPRSNPYEYGDNPFRNGGPFGYRGSFNDPGYNTGFDYEDFYTTYEKERQKERDKRKEESRRAREAKAQNWTWNGERSGDKGYKKVYTQKCRDCTVCKITRLTADEDTPYICYECKIRKV